MSEVYERHGHQFNFGDPVEATCVLMPKDQCVGRLVQVRKAIGQFKSDVYFVRRANGTLQTFENVGLIPYTESELPPIDVDSVEAEYTVKGEWPEVGFVIEQPRQPESYSPAFAITVSKQNDS